MFRAQCPDGQDGGLFTEEGAVVHIARWAARQDNAHRQLAVTQVFAAKLVQHPRHPQFESFGDGNADLIPAIENQDVAADTRLAEGCALAENSPAEKQVFRPDHPSTRRLLCLSEKNRFWQSL